MRCTAVGQGPAVLLLHAGGERRSVWRPVADELAARGFRTVAVDQRGHGETGGPVPAQLDPYVRDVQAVIDALAAPVASWEHRSVAWQRCWPSRSLTEIDFINGYVVRTAQRHAIAAPLNTAIVALIDQIEARERSIGLDNLAQLTGYACEGR